VQQRFHRGAAVLARELDVPILPVAICGTYDVLPRGREQIRSAPVQVRFGPPLRPDPQETEQNLLARMWAAVRQLREPDAQPREPIPAPMDVYSKPMG
jgi:1-acyl-sn-glycerol-3-phosphate acyltransferase